jgi:hypothetical protein
MKDGRLTRSDRHREGEDKQDTRALSGRIGSESDLIDIYSSHFLRETSVCFTENAS